MLLMPLLANAQTHIITVIDDEQRQVTLTDPAKRIVALSPHLAELVFEAGAGSKLVATVEYANFPVQAEYIPKVGSHNAIDVERLLSFQPDLVLAWYSGTSKNLLDQLSRLGLNVYLSEPDNLTDIGNAIRDIGLMAGTSEVADASASEFDDRLLALRNKYSSLSKLDVFIQVWQQPLITVNGKQLISRVIELCGGHNLFDGEMVLAPVISLEGLLVSNPEVIIGTAIETQQASWTKAWLGLKDIRAVQKNNLYFIEPDLLNRQTSRILQGAEQMCGYLEQARQKRALP